MLDIELPDSALIPGGTWIKGVTTGLNKVSSLHFDEQQFNVEHSSTGYRISIANVASKGFPYGDIWNFGIELGAGFVTIYPGIIRVGNKYWQSAETEIELTAATLIGWTWKPDTLLADGEKALTIETLTIPTTGDLEAGHEFDSGSAIINPLYKIDSGLKLEKVYNFMGYPQVWGVR